jgi:putative ABC transport system substrate-binding protein
MSLLGGAAIALPIAARAQEPGRVYRIMILAQNRRDTPHMIALFDELRISGFVEGQNLAVIPGGFDSRNDQLSERAFAMVKAQPDVIMTVGDLATRAAQAASKTLPIVGAAEDIVAAGLVKTMSRPEANVTGVSMLSLELDGKRQDLLIGAVPGARKIAALTDAAQFNTATPQHLTKLKNSAQARGIDFSVFSVREQEDIGAAIDSAKAWGAEAVNVLASPMLNTHRKTIFARVNALRLPAIYQWPDSAEDGGFAAYGPRLPDVYRQRARMVAKLLRGAKPADIPVEQPTRFELVLNLKTAKAIGHEIPAGLVLRADKLIE